MPTTTKERLDRLHDQLVDIEAEYRFLYNGKLLKYHWGDAQLCWHASEIKLAINNAISRLATVAEKLGTETIDQRKVRKNEIL